MSLTDSYILPPVFYETSAGTKVYSILDRYPTVISVMLPNNKEYKVRRHVLMEKVNNEWIESTIAINEFNRLCDELDPSKISELETRGQLAMVEHNLILAPGFSLLK